MRCIRAAGRHLRRPPVHDDRAAVTARRSPTPPFQAATGGDTAEPVPGRRAPDLRALPPGAILVGASCTGELIQDDPAVAAAPIWAADPVIPLELRPTRRGELGRGETFYRLACPALSARAAPRPRFAWPRRPCLQPPRPTAWASAPRRRGRGHARCSPAGAWRSTSRLPLGATPADIARLPKPTSTWSPTRRSPAGGDLAEKTFGQPDRRRPRSAIGRHPRPSAPGGGPLDRPRYAGPARCPLPWYPARSTRPTSPASGCSCSAMPRT